MPIKKDITKKDKNGDSKIMTISYKIKILDSFRSMSSSISNLADNLSEGFHSDKRTDCKSCLDYITIKDEQLIFRCFERKKNYEKDINKELKYLQIYMNFAMKTLINLYCY